MANNRGFDEHDMVRQHQSKAHKLRNAVVTLMERKGMIGHVVKGTETRTKFEDHDASLVGSFTYFSWSSQSV